MIFLHGANSGGSELGPFVAAMQPYTAVRTPNIAGHAGRALSERPTMRGLADDLAAWMDGEGIERDVVGGYSIGGTLALYFARHHPQRVSGVVTLAAKHVFDAAAMRYLQHLLTHERLERLVLPGARIRRVDELARLHAPNTWQDVADFNSRLFATFASDPPLPAADLAAIRAPVMIVSASLDQIVPWAETLALGRALPDANVAMFYGPGHPLLAIPLPAIARAIHQWMVQKKLA